jgi:SAM-dependent methyltransferase
MMINAVAMKPFGMAIADYYKGDKDAAVAVYRDDGLVENLAILSFFRSPTAYPLDKVALDNCRGRVLDVGAGVGIHSLYLQDKGFSVCAMDVSPEACEVMKKEGVKEVHCASFEGFSARLFDTLLILGRSICMVETLAGLQDFLEKVHSLVRPGGQIILNSVDVTRTSNPQHLAYHDINRREGRYVGECRLHMEYKGVKGPVCGLLHVEAATLAEYAEKTGWSCDILVQEDDGNYLARLVKKN